MNAYESRPICPTCWHKLTGKPGPELVSPQPENADRCYLCNAPAAVVLRGAEEPSDVAVCVIHWRFPERD